MNELKKIILSNKQIVNEFKKLNESSDSRWGYIEKLGHVLKKSLPKSFPFIKEVSLEPKETVYGDGGKTFFIITTNIGVNVDNLPDYEYLAGFVKYYNENQEYYKVRFGNLKYYYEETHRDIGEKLTELVIQDIVMYKNNLFHLFDVDESDFYINIYFIF